MDRSKIFFRHLFMHYFDMNKCAFETHKILTRVYGNKSPSLSTIKNWFGRFKKGDFSVDDKYRLVKNSKK